MEKRIRIGLVGDFDEKMYTHVKLNESIDHCRPFFPATVQAEWVPTQTLKAKFNSLQDYDGFWITPGSPYQDDEAVYKLIQWSREKNFPLLGTCGGFQYMAVEYARNVLGLTDAGHEESDPGSPTQVVSRLTCSLKGGREEVIIADRNSWLFRILGSEKITGHFNCSYGVNPAYQAVLNKEPFVFTASSPSGEPRALELKTHRFFNGTLFQPPLDSSPGAPNPLVLDFLRKVSA